MENQTKRPVSRKYRSRDVVALRRSNGRVVQSGRVTIIAMREAMMGDKRSVHHCVTSKLNNFAQH